MNGASHSRYWGEKTLLVARDASSTTSDARPRKRRSVGPCAERSRRKNQTYAAASAARSASVEIRENVSVFGPVMLNDPMVWLTSTQVRCISRATGEIA